MTGCWFCRREDSNSTLFSYEWDTPVHRFCILRALDTGKSGEYEEAVSMAEEFGMVCPGPECGGGVVIDVNPPICGICKRRILL